MTYCAEGFAPEKLPPTEPYSWIFDENAVKAEAKFWHDFRSRSIEYRTANPDGFEGFQRWDEIQDGW